MISKTCPQPLAVPERPLNREAPLSELVSKFLTPTPDAYNRNHSAIPELDPGTHTVSITGDVANPLRLSVDQLRHEFPQHEVLSALQCAGNRRHTMRTKLKEVVGLDWMDGAVMNCTWSGPRLRDVLIKAGVRGYSNDTEMVKDQDRKENKETANEKSNTTANRQQNSKNNSRNDGARATTGEAEQAEMHVHFNCSMLPCEDDSYYGASIELWRAMELDREVIIALDMNGKPLLPEYGYPVRIVVPGVAGARWVKWLDTISVHPHESPSFYQQHDYKILPPEALTWEIAEQYWSKVPSMQSMPINSVVAVPNDDETVTLPASGKIEVKGFAVPEGAEGPVTRVEVSADGGETWVDAELDYGENGDGNGDNNDMKMKCQTSKWSWVLWRAEVEVTRGGNKTIYSRATDAGGNTQQEMSPWNLRGVGYNGYGASWNVSVV
ncbi:uncharacterized protein PADG_02728 [Paracoccidioides brasiliensis Pb18]|uniref:Sulfite oxidase n=1 Tax=Paracoccidioides brasiliensis (strain Pb18) TaxID=502780 RepID=C1G6C3_PARBD|nr:uncharacterized protein PADG_02728 [Paracoccidioides brasiliensis Pb18]EEH46630.2 hypothetical protein PADG_02728 [Paracoccidioides brasiliensis Pb18]